MSIVSLEAKDEKNFSMSIAQFFAAYGIISLLSKCGGLKLKGVPVRKLFAYTVTNAFRMGSFHMQQKAGTIREKFSKNTYYRFLASPRINWLRFTTLLSGVLSIATFAHLHPKNVITALSLTIHCMKGQASSAPNMQLGCLTMWQSGIRGASDC